MHNRILIRVLLIIYILIALAASALMLFAALGLLSPSAAEGWMNGVYYDTGTKIIVSVLAIAMIIISFILLFARFDKSGSKALTQKIRERDFGSISIAISALEEIGRRYFNDLKEVRSIKLNVVPVKTGVDVHVQMALAPQVVIPDLTAKVQEELKACLETYTGIIVNRVELTVFDSALASK